jgi:hypothetical protein
MVKASELKSGDVISKMTWTGDRATSRVMSVGSESIILEDGDGYTWGMHASCYISLDEHLKGYIKE